MVRWPGVAKHRGIVTSPLPFRYRLDVWSWAGADGVAVSEGLVDWLHRRPVAVGSSCRAQRGVRVGGDFAAIGVMPLADELFDGVRCIHEWVVVARPLAVFDVANLPTDLFHGAAETFELVEILRLGRFDHEGAGDREAHGRGVETVVDQPLGNV